MSASKYVSDRNKPEIIDGRIKELEDRIKYLCEKQIPLLINSLEKAETSSQNVKMNPEIRSQINQRPSRPSIPSIPSTASDNNVICSVEDIDDYEEPEARVPRKALPVPPVQRNPLPAAQRRNGNSVINNQRRIELENLNTTNYHDDPFQGLANKRQNNTQRKVNPVYNNQRNGNSAMNNQRKTGLENLNTTNYHDDPFQGLANNRITKSQKGVPSNIKIFTIIFIIGVLGSVGFFIYKNSTETQDPRNQNRTSQERFQVSLSDLNAKEKETPPLRSTLTNSDELPSGVTETSKGYLNSKYNTLYLAGEGDKITILESTWKTEQGAEYRLQSLKKSGIFEGKDIKLTTEKAGTENIYKIYISDFPSLQEANQCVTKFNLTAVRY